jgi:hypothetical protein
MKKIIELLHDLNYFEVHSASSVRPAPPPPRLGGPLTEYPTLDNSVQYPKGTRLEVEADKEREALEPSGGKTWFKNDKHPGGFLVPNADFRYIESAKD